MLLTPCGLDFVNTLLYHLKALQLSFFLFFLFSFPTLSQGYNTLHYSTLPIYRGIVYNITNKDDPEA